MHSAAVKQYADYMLSNSSAEGINAFCSQPLVRTTAAAHIDSHMFQHMFLHCVLVVFWRCDAQLQRIFELGGASVLAYTNAHLAPGRSLSQSIHPASYTLLSAGV
jgi:hypothetical protein